MMKIRKVYNVRVISIAISILFLFNNFLYCDSVAGYLSLRVPILFVGEEESSDDLLIENALWSEIKEEPKQAEKKEGLLVKREVKYKSKVYFATWGRIKKYNNKFILPQIRYLKELEKKGIRGIPKVERILKMEDDRIVILCEKIKDKGETLDKKIGKISQGEVISIILEVSRIVKELHSNNIFHWDITPKNIYITDKGKVMLLDFDLAFNITSGEFKDRGLYEIGNLNYLSKNRGDGNFSAADEVYSLAVSLFAVLPISLFLKDEKPKDWHKPKEIINFLESLVTLEQGVSSKEFLGVLQRALCKYDLEGKLNYYGDSSYESVGEFIKALEGLIKQRLAYSSKTYPASEVWPEGSKLYAHLQKGKDIDSHFKTFDCSGNFSIKENSLLPIEEDLIACDTKMREMVICNDAKSYYAIGSFCDYIACVFKGEKDGKTVLVYANISEIDALSNVLRKVEDLKLDNLHAVFDIENEVVEEIKCMISKELPILFEASENGRILINGNERKDVNANRIVTKEGLIINGIPILWYEVARGSGLKEFLWRKRRVTPIDL
ncbi:MAG: protein kinase domain-containing protein [Planctomycetota bacterium]|jgi:serine/threonine protein kinase